MDSAFDLASIDFLCTTYDDVPLTAFCPFNDYFTSPVGMPSLQTTYHAHSAFPSNLSYQSTHDQFDDVTVKPDPSFEKDHHSYKMNACSSIDQSKQQPPPHKLIFKELNITQPNGVVSPADLLNFINSSTYQPHRSSSSLKTAQKQNKPSFSQTFVQTVNTSNIKNFHSMEENQIPTSQLPSATTWQTTGNSTVSSNCIIDQLLKSNSTNTCNQSCCQSNNNSNSNSYASNNSNISGTPTCNSATTTTTTTTVVSSSEIDISSAAAVQNYLSLFNNNNNNHCSTKNGVHEKHGYMSDNDSTDSFCDISEYLHLPQNKAAKKLQIPASTLSKRWKEASMNKKWPYRDIRKIDKEIEAVVHALNSSSSAPSSPSPSEAVEENNQQLAALLRKRKEFMRPIYIRLSM